MQLEYLIYHLRRVLHTECVAMLLEIVNERAANFRRWPLSLFSSHDRVCMEMCGGVVETSAVFDAAEDCRRAKKVAVRVTPPPQHPLLLPSWSWSEIVHSHELE